MCLRNCDLIDLGGSPQHQVFFFFSLPYSSLGDSDLQPLTTGLKVKSQLSAV